MALLKEEQTPFGITANYWRISLDAAPHYPSSDDNVLSLRVSILCYINQQARLDQKEPLTLLTKSVILTGQNARLALSHTVDGYETIQVEEQQQVTVNVYDENGELVLDEFGNPTTTTQTITVLVPQTNLVQMPDPRPIIYSYLKTLPEFDGATDC